MKKVKYLKSVFMQRILPELLASEDMHCILQCAGVDVGKHTIFYHPGRTVIDTSRPCLLQIGDYCKITSGVIILTHDYSRSVLRRVYGDIIGEGRKTTIGNNVFIGMNSIILMGSTIGSNVIIGAGSVVSGNIPDNVVVAGNPAKVIRTLDEHYEIMKRRMFDDADSFFYHYYTKYGKAPSIKEMNPFFPLFLPRDAVELEENGISMNLGGDEESEVLSAFMASTPVYSGYDAFIKHCEEKFHGQLNI